MNVPTGRPDIGLLLTALRQPASLLTLDPDGWDLLVRSARRAKLLATLQARLDAAGVLSQVDALPARHLDSAIAHYRFRRQKALSLLTALAPVVAGDAHPVVLLKGSAYVMQQMPLCAGRIFSDVDIMVPKTALDAVEKRLLQAGWSHTVRDAHDQRYYRDWSHELPPLAHPNHVLTLDVHHTILPVTGKVRIDAGQLLRDAIPLADSPWHVLDPADQFAHACLHLFQDSDCVDRLREIVDLDMLIRTHCQHASFWPRLRERCARNPGIGRTVWYGLRYCQALLDTPVPESVSEALNALAPGGGVRRVMDHAIAQVMFGPHPDAHHDAASPFWAGVLKARAMHLRMPLHLLAYHAAVKLTRGRKTSRAA